MRKLLQNSSEVYQHRGITKTQFLSSWHWNVICNIQLHFQNKACWQTVRINVILWLLECYYAVWLGSGNDPSLGLNVITHVMYTTSFTSFMYVNPLAFHTSKTNYTLILGRERDKSYVWPTQQSQPRANLGFLAIYATATAPEGRFTGSHSAKLRMAAAFDALAVRTGWLFRNSRLKIRSCSFALCKFPPSLLDFAPRLVVREACHLFLYFLTYFAIYYHCYQELVKLERL